MNETLRKANVALLEGNRDEVLRLLAEEAPTAEVLWLRANAVEDEQERLQLLRRVASSTDKKLARLAQAIVQREDEYARKLSEPPPYQFWKRSGWQARLHSIRQHRWRYFALMVVVLGTLIALLVWNGAVQNQRQAVAQLAQQQTLTATFFLSPTLVPPTLTPSVTPLPQRWQASVSYPAGMLKLIRVEFPTTRPVSHSGSLATPAVGAQFAAVELEFVCQIALCSQPPQAVLMLRLDDGQVISYEGGSQPLLAEQPYMPRVSSGETVTGWLVFEVPVRNSPEALLIWTGREDPVLEIPWPR